MKHLAQSVLLSFARHSGLVRKAAAVIDANLGRDGYEYLRAKFIQNGAGSHVDSAARREIVARFETIDRSVPIASTPIDGLAMAELLINCEGAGDVVECGCFSGGSTAKLSIIVQKLGKRLHVFDSFEGLPEVDADNLRDHHARRSREWTKDWSAGRYAARLDYVKDNVTRFGEVDVCTFVKGWFSDTLKPENLPERIAFAFVDVDIPSSARDCLRGLWPRLSEQGVFVSHDAAYIKVLQQFHDPELWRNEFRAFPPIFFGAGFGIYDGSPHLGYMIKGESTSADYLKRLTLDK